MELEVANARDELRGKDEEDTATTQQRRRALAALKAQAEYLEAASVESAKASERVLAEVRHLFPLVEVVFHVLGCRATVAAQQKGGPDGALAEAPTVSSPMRYMPTASLKMYSSPVVAAEFTGDAGVAASSMPQYMGMIETRGSDLVQLYAAMIATGALTSDGAEATDEEQRAADKRAAVASEAAAGAAAAAGSDGGEGGTPASSPTPALRAPAADAPSARTFLSPAALGPSRPTGRLKESLTTSALIAAMAPSSLPGHHGEHEGGGVGGTTRSSARFGAAAAAAAAAAAEEDDDDDGSGVRPLTHAELKRQAIAHIAADRNMRAIASAATAASSYLARSGPAM